MSCPPTAAEEVPGHDRCRVPPEPSFLGSESGIAPDHQLPTLKTSQKGYNSSPIPNIEAMIKKSHFQWTGHVIRTEKNRMPTQRIKLALDGIVTAP
ncbi:hypothetical protein RRG08_018456 [Elysia crispata]|uniref:Uncharacterized protein n=1 Tax=Elysia crispata TaxID=231223 RepID=A0AAE0YUZ3_9GAST|nr:hypothetical protein RRG08_018456 [Elysia crispata]